MSSEKQDLDLKALQIKLRQAFVNEIVGENRYIYEEFLSDNVNYLAEANKFLQDGFYANCLGDLMPLAMATILQATLVIFTTDSLCSPLYVTPPSGSPERVIFLIYMSSGPGHYDAAIPYSLVLGNTGTTHDNMVVERMSCSH